jgi:integrase
MTKKARKSSERIKCEYFCWLLSKRNGVFQADGRGNRPPAGRHSLETRSEVEALDNLRELDRVQAVTLGLADKNILRDHEPGTLLFEDGETRYLEYCRRPAVVGGPKPATPKRYRPILRKAIAHFRELGLTTWNQIKKTHLESYAAWLDGEGYAYGGEFIEITTLKQTIAFFVREGLLPITSRIVMPMKKPTDSDTYCYTVPEVKAMISRCRSHAALAWLADVILALSTTGMRISELADLRWTSVDLERKVILLKDERRSKIAARRTARTTKSGKSRDFPIHHQLLDLLNRRAATRNTGYVFRAAKGGMLRANNVREGLIKNVIEPLSEDFPSPDDEVGFKDGRLHSFRHFFCSECANRGVSEQALMSWLGHQNSTMIRRYYHLHHDESRRQIKKLDFLDEPTAS